MKIIEVIKENKKAILKKALIIGGTILAAGIVMKMVKSGDEVEEIEIPEEGIEETTNEESSEV